MSTFLSYSESGAKVGGFKPLAIQERGREWRRIFDGSRECNTPAFLDGNVVIAQDFAYINQGKGAFLRTLDGRTFDRKASRLFAGGGRWVSQYEQWMPNTPVGTRTVVLYDGMDRIIPGDGKTFDVHGNPTSYYGAGQHGVGLDGTLAYTPRFHSTAGGVIVEDRDSRVITTLTGIPVTKCSVIDRNAIGVFAAGDVWHVWIWDGLGWTKHELADSAYEAEIVRVGGDICAIVGNVFLQVHPVTNRRRGWQFGRAGFCYNGTGWQDRIANKTFVAWSENAGASVVWDSNGKVVADSTREAELVGVPKPWPLRQPPAITRCLWRGFDGSKSDGTEVKQPGNFAWGQPTAGETRPFVEAMPWAKTIRKPMVGLYISTEEVPSPYVNLAEWIDVTVEESIRRSCAIWVYSDNPVWLTAAETIAKTCESRGRPVVRVVQAYLRTGERAAQARDRVRGQVSRVSDRSYVGLMQRADATPGIDPEELHAFTDECESLLADDELNLVAQLLFGVRRPGVVASVVSYATTAIANMAPGDPPVLVPPSPPDPPDPPDPTKLWFPPVERFMSDTMTIRALQKQTSWNNNADGQGDRPIWGNVRPDGPLNANGEGRVSIGTDASNRPDNPQDDPPDEASKIVLRSHGTGPEDPIDIYFATGDQFQLTGMPGGEIQTRRHDAVDLQELWNDGKLGGRESVFHANGESFRVLR